MKRKEFITKTALAAYLAGTVSILDLVLSGTVFPAGFLGKNINPGDTAPINEALQAEVETLFRWIRSNQWDKFLGPLTGVDLSQDTPPPVDKLIHELDSEHLQRIRSTIGFEDFAGNSLIRPGYPCLSLLYHALASARVRNEGVLHYPTYNELDILENYIYALDKFDIKEEELRDNYVLAVFAYEYRPAFKTPHHKYADLVFSRTGIARIGNEPMNYDAINRSFTNKPADAAKENNVAVVPARYALFLAKKVKYDEISLMKTGTFKDGDINSDVNDAGLGFLCPVRKIFRNDMLAGGNDLMLSEFHRGTKLYKLSKKENFKFFGDSKPEEIKSKDLVEQDNNTRINGSSFLVISKYRQLIRHAKGTKGFLYFEVPGMNVNNRYFNAYYSLKTGVEDIEILQANKDKGYWHKLNKYKKARNQPMYMNITYEKLGIDSGSYEHLKIDKDEGYSNLINREYYSPVFEDSICDGSVFVETSLLDFSKLPGLARVCLPAFSVITAPDFFPQVDAFDLLNYDVGPGLSKESNFYEGGVASLATARIRPNPRVMRQKDDPTEKTYTAVYTSLDSLDTETTKELQKKWEDPTAEKGYQVSGFLPDVSSSIFAPGWDVTYCKDQEFGDDIYVGTEGLGAPFPEDMKLCAAMNGMWPVASPDAARTYQGSLKKRDRNPTAIPLLDSEIGYHEIIKPPGTLGWDGEQGPFIEPTTNEGKWYVNFTDLSRADVVQNTIEGKLDMTNLRKLTSAELVARMECLKLCIQHLPVNNMEKRKDKFKVVGYTYHWLVSAEKVNWGVKDAEALGIPLKLLGNDKDWITNKENAQVKGKGYLFVFVDTTKNNTIDRIDKKRMRQQCEDIYVCQVTNAPVSGSKKLAWTKIAAGELKWNFNDTV